MINARACACEDLIRLSFMLLLLCPLTVGSVSVSNADSVDSRDSLAGAICVVTYVPGRTFNPSYIYERDRKHSHSRYTGSMSHFTLASQSGIRERDSHLVLAHFTTHYHTFMVA